MATRKAVVANTQRPGRAMLVPATSRDSYLANDKWVGVSGYSTWEYGKPVDAIRIFNQHEYAVGDALELYDFEDRHGATMTVEAIRMIVCADITDADIDLLGYRDRAEWVDQTEGGWPKRKAWLLVGNIDVHQINGAGQNAATVTTRNAETGESHTVIVDLRDHGVQ